MTYALKMGRHMIRDILNPTPDEIDLVELEVRLRTVRRFSNDPRALTVHQHRALAHELATYENETSRVKQWCWHHDDHEAITGDIPGPLKALLGTETPLLYKIEEKLDLAICEARGVEYPSAAARTVTHRYDKQAETIEWTMVLGNDLAPWNEPVKMNESDQCRLLLRSLRRV
jgi:hypothetical protein